MSRKGFTNPVLKVFFFLLVMGVIVSHQLTIAKEPNTYPTKAYEVNDEHEFVPGQLIVVMNEGYEESSASDMKSLNNVRSDENFFTEIEASSIEELTKAKNPVKCLDSQRQTVVPTTSGTKMLLVKLKNKSKQDVLEAIKKLKNNPKVKYAEPDYIFKLADTTPNDPDYSKQYGMEKISASKVWDNFTGSASVVVGVMDSGIDYNHVDLRNNIWTNPGEISANGIDDDGNGYIDDYYGWDFGNDDNDPIDEYGHGTHVAGIIAGVGNNGTGVSGVTWNTKLAALKISDDRIVIRISCIIQALDYANKMGFPITNNSYGSYGTYSKAFKDLISEGGLFIASAGNNGWDNDTRPCFPASYSCSNIISVAATDQKDDFA